MSLRDKIIDGRKLATKISLELQKDFSRLNRKVNFGIFQVGNNLASNKYIKYKVKKAEELGINATVIKFEKSISEEDLKKIIQEHLSNLDAAIVQLPLPSHIDKQEILNQIPYQKDVDGLAKGNNKVIPATPRGIMLLLDSLNLDMKSLSVSVVGQSNLVGKPVSELCRKVAKEVRVYDESTGIKGTENSDILIVAAGHTALIKSENIKQGAIVIDVGINEIADKNAMKKIVGDVARTKEVIDKVKRITPVPGGVGPMTVISLFKNIYDVVK